MDPREQAIVERAMAEEFDLVGIDDPAEMRRVVQTRLQEMNALDRAALNIRIGQMLREAEVGGPASVGYRVAAYCLFVVIAWFIWRPLAAVIAISATGNGRQWVLSRVVFWTPNTVVVVGTIYGLCIAVFVRIISILSTTSHLGATLLATLGLLAAGYVGYPAPAETYHGALGDERRGVIQVAAIIGYVLATIALMFGPTLLKAV